MATRIDWQPGDVFLDHYRVDRLLGTGGMGKVYRVEHRGWGAPLAVKVPRPELVDDVTHMLSFERECETWVSLGHHPNIVSCYFVRRHEGIPLVFAEYAPYGSLHDWIVRGKLYEGSQKAIVSGILDIAIQFAQGLAYAHGHGLVHQDVKPSNVMVGMNRTVKVTDFGLAKAHAAMGTIGLPAKAGPTVTAAGMTPAYCSPEQAAGDRLTAKTDVWSWAVSVMEMFTGGCHWMSGVAARDVLKEHVRQQNSEERQGHKIPRDLALLLDTCFRSGASRRPAGMEEIVRELQNIYTSITNDVYPRILVTESCDPADPISIANANNRAVSMIELGRTKEALDALKDAELSARAFADFGLGTELQDLAYNQSLLQIRTNPVYNVNYVPSLIPKRPDELRHEFLVGMLFLEAGRIPEAIEQLTHPAQRSSAFQSDALNARGIALLLGGETGPSVLSFEAALQLSPDRLDCIRNLAIARYYHGDTYGALTLFERLSGQQRLDAVDAVRFAAVLSSAGQVARSGEFLHYLHLSGSPPAQLLITAAEVGLGVQSFLPDLVPTGEDFDECRRWILEALSEEPDNLRAEVDRKRFPRRVVLSPEVELKRGKRVPPEDADAEVLADRLAASYELLQRRVRWGDLPGSEGAPVRLATTLITIAAGLACGVVLFRTSTLLEVFGSNNLIVAIGCWSALVLSTGFIVLRRQAAESVLRTAAGFCVVVPGTLILPTVAHDTYFAMNDFVDVGVAGGRTKIWFFMQFSLVLIILFLLRDLPFRTMGSRMRAWGGYSRPTAITGNRQPAVATEITAMARLTRLTQRARGGAAGYSARRQTSRLTHWLFRAATAHLRNYPKLWAAALRYRSLSGAWHLLLLPQFFALALADAAWIAFIPEAPMAAYVAWMMTAHFAFWGVAPYLARPFVVATFLLGPIIGLEFVRRCMPFSENSNHWMFGFAVLFLGLNAAALRRCPAFAPLWESVPRGRWNIDSFMDPLDLRRYAAPWRLIRVTNTVEKL